MEKLFTNQSEVDRAIRAAVKKYNEIYSSDTIVICKLSRHRKNKTQAQRT